MGGRGWTAFFGIFTCRLKLQLFFQSKNNLRSNKRLVLEGFAHWGESVPMTAVIKILVTMGLTTCMCLSRAGLSWQGLCWLHADIAASAASSAKTFVDLDRPLGLNYRLTML